MRFFFYFQFLVLALALSATADDRRDSAPDPEFFAKHIQPIFNSRCIQCHSCYNAPCQLNLTSVEGLNRGMVQGFDVYSPRKLRAEEPSRLGIDRKSVEDWRRFSREYRFQPVVPDTVGSQASLIQQVIAHKAAHPNELIDDLGDFKNQAAENSRECADTPSKLATHLSKRPSAGMPYGLPPLSEEEIALVTQWTEMGSPREAKAATISPEEQRIAQNIETFFNSFTETSDLAQAKKKSLVSRYIYEHLFLANLYIKNENAPSNFFRLVRSKTVCSAGIDEAPTRRPWNDPEEKFYYCLKPVTAALVHKTHMPILVDEKRLARWNSLFFSIPWEVSFGEKRGFSRLTSWFSQSKGWPADVAPRSDAEASNPLFVFKDIPVQARYQFLLDDAGYQVDTFIRGPVCKGNTAVNSIDEQFYVFFVKPESDLMVKDQKFHQNAIPLHLLPAHKGSEQIGGIRVGRKIRETRNKYRELRDAAFGQAFPEGYDTSDIWNGQGNADKHYSSQPNTNAALTVVRNYDSSAVKKGLIGATPKTIFLLDYSLLERLVYVLVTGFDVYGDIGHQMHTRLYMAYLRMESEENFLNLLPPNVREPMRKSWYVSAKGITEKIGNNVNAVLMREKDKMSRRFPLLGQNRPTKIKLDPLDLETFYNSAANLQEETLRHYRRKVVKILKEHLGTAVAPTLANPDKRIGTTVAAPSAPIRTMEQFEAELAKFTDVKALAAPWVLKMPSLSYILVESSSGPEIYTLIRNKEHFNIAWIFGEGGRRNFAADSMTLYKGVMGSYPNQIFTFNLRDAHKFLQGMAGLHDHESYENWIQEFGAAKTGAASANFWQKSDRVHQVFQMKYPLDFGALDFNRYGMDYRYHKDESEDDDFMSQLPADLSDAAKDSFGDEQ